MKQKGFAHPLIIIAVLILAVVAYIAFTSYKKPVSVKKGATPTPTPLTALRSPTAAPQLNIPEDWKTYTNSTYKFEMQYPKPFLAVETGPNQAEITVKNGGTISGTLNPILDIITFTDSNNIQFTLNVYPISADASVNTNLKNLYEYSGVCGTQLAKSTLTNRITEINGTSYKEVVQTDSANKNLTDFCFFNPLGNLMVLRNNNNATVVAMDKIISSFKFSQ